MLNQKPQSETKALIKQVQAYKQMEICVTTVRGDAREKVTYARTVFCVHCPLKAPCEVVDH